MPLCPKVDPNARIIFGASIDESASEGEIRITVIATGFDFEQNSNSGNNIPPRRTIELDTDTTDDIDSKTKKKIEPVSSDDRKIDDLSISGEDSESDRIEGGFKLFNKKKADFKSEQPKKIIKKDFMEDLKIEEKKSADMDDTEVPAFIRKKLGR